MTTLDRKRNETPNRYCSNSLGQIMNQCLRTLHCPVHARLMHLRILLPRDVQTSPASCWELLVRSTGELFRSVSSSSNAANLPQCTPCEDARTARALPNCWEPSCLSSPVVLCPALEDSLASESAIVRSNASNTSDLTGGATSVAINGSSSESNCVGVLTTRLATFLVEQPEKNLRVPLRGASSATCGAGFCPLRCLHPQQTTLDGRRRHLTHSCSGPTGSHASDSVVGPNCPQSPPRRNYPQLCHRRCDHPHQERKEPHADCTGPCTCGVCEKGLDVMPLQS